MLYGTIFLFFKALCATQLRVEKLLRCCCCSWVILALVWIFWPIISKLSIFIWRETSTMYIKVKYLLAKVEVTSQALYLFNQPSETHDFFFTLKKIIPYELLKKFKIYIIFTIDSGSKQKALTSSFIISILHNFFYIYKIFYFSEQGVLGLS